LFSTYKIFTNLLQGTKIFVNIFTTLQTRVTQIIIIIEVKSKQKSRTNKFQALARRLYISPLYFYDLIWENACKMTKKEAGGQNENRCRDTKWGADFCGGRRENLATREQYNRKLFFFHLSFFGVDFATYLCPEPRIFCCLVGLCVASLMGQQVLLL